MFHWQALDDSFTGPAGMPYTDPRFRAYLHYGWIMAWNTRGFTRRKLAPKHPSLNDIAYAICVVSEPHFKNAF